MSKPDKRNGQPSNKKTLRRKLSSSKLNPYNWVVPDYTSSGDFTSAYRDALKAGEKEFMWNNKRFNTDYKGTLQQQLKEIGITNIQRLRRNKIRSRIDNNLQDVEYHDVNQGNKDDPLFPIKKMKRIIIDNKKEKNYSTGVSDHTHKDFLSFYLGQPQKYNTIRVSKYIPQDSKDKGKVYYAVNNEALYDYILKHVDEDYLKKGIRSGAINYVRDKKGKIIPNRYLIRDIGTGLGEFTISFGEDSNGKYISYWDKWDLNPYKGRYSAVDISKIGDLSFGIGKPFEIYDRIYYKDNPDANKFKEYDDKIEELWDLAQKTQDPKYMDEAFKLYPIRNSYYNKQQPYIRQYYSDKELSELDINKKNFDTSALQRELSSRGYKLPKSTKRDGTFDGVFGEETKQALLDYQNKQNKQNKYKDGGEMGKPSTKNKPLPKDYSQSDTTFVKKLYPFGYINSYEGNYRTVPDIPEWKQIASNPMFLHANLKYITRPEDQEGAIGAIRQMLVSLPGQESYVRYLDSLMYNKDTTGIQNLLNEYQNFSNPRPEKFMSEYTKKYGVGGDIAGGALEGAGTGAAMGSLIPVVGPAIGAGVGAVVGGISGYLTGKKQDEIAAAEEERQMKENMANERLASIIPQPNYTPLAEYGGLLEYKGDTHQDASGGIPVDENGNVVVVNDTKPVALTENNEVVWKKRGEKPFVFSDKLGYAKEAKKIIKKYKLDKKPKVHDPLLDEAITKQLENLSTVQELEKASKGKESSLSYGNGGSISAMKARKILKDGTIRGKKLTPRQRRFFGFIAGGGKPRKNFDGGGTLAPAPYVLGFLGDLGEYISTLSNKPVPMQAAKTYAPTVDFSQERSALNEQGRVARATNALNARNLGMNAGQAFNSISAANTAVNRGVNSAIGQSYQREAATNAQSNLQANLANQQAQNTANYYNTMMTNSYLNRLQALNPMSAAADRASQYFSGNQAYQLALTEAQLQAPNATIESGNDTFSSWFFGLNAPKVTWSGRPIENPYGKDSGKGGK